jgi:hypothetical protein
MVVFAGARCDAPEASCDRTPVAWPSRLSQVLERAAAVLDAHLEQYKETLHQVLMHYEPDERQVKALRGLAATLEGKWMTYRGLAALGDLPSTALLNGAIMALEELLYGYCFHQVHYKLRLLEIRLTNKKDREADVGRTQDCA